MPHTCLTFYRFWREAPRRVKGLGANCLDGGYKNVASGIKMIFECTLDNLDVFWLNGTWVLDFFILFDLSFSFCINVFYMFIVCFITCIYHLFILSTIY